MELLPHLEVEPSKSATASVIWLHGLGADGHDFEPVVPHLELPESLPVRFIFPHAPSRPITINGGASMPAWYDIFEMSLDRKIDTPQLMQSAVAVHNFIARELERGISSDRIVIAGFSQGGAVGFEAALSYDKPLAGLLAMSTYFATADSVMIHPCQSALPIHILHGTEDEMVAESHGQKSRATLEDRGFTPQYKTYPIGHTVSLDEIREIGAWLRRVLEDQ